MIELGKINKFKVIRKSDLGYMLIKDSQEILMHYKEASKELNIDEEIDAYVYTDKENRLTATMHQPNLLIDKPNFVKVVNVIPDFGVFIDNNTIKDLLVSKDYLPYDFNLWPIVGDTLFCGLKIKKNYLVAKPLGRFDIKFLKSEAKYADGEYVDAFVTRIAEKGLGLVTVDSIYVFVPNTQLRKEYRLGEQVQVKITKMLDNEAYGTLNENKEILMNDDKKVILDYLKEHKVMYLTAKSSSEEVEKIFNMSRKAFKRAYGALYKEQLIEFDETKTRLKKESN